MKTPLAYKIKAKALDVLTLVQIPLQLYLAFIHFIAITSFGGGLQGVDRTVLKLRKQPQGDFTLSPVVKSDRTNS